MVHEKYLTFNSFLIGWVEAIEDEYALLSYYVSATKFNVDTHILELENIKNGVEGFDFQSMRLKDTSYAGGSGQLDFEEVLENGLMYFESDGGLDQSFSMPIDEVIEILKEYKEHLVKGGFYD